MPDFVRLVNTGTDEFDFHQNNTKRIIQAGEDVIVPWNIACTLLGDPRIPDIPPANERTRMYEKIRARHNFAAGLQPEEEWELPALEVWDLETEARVIMLVEDPKGEHMADAPASKSITKESDVATLQKQVDILTKQITKLVGAAQAAPSEPAVGAAVTPGEDAPEIDSAFGLEIPEASGEAGEDTPQATSVDEDGPAPRKRTAKKAAAASK